MAHWFANKQTRGFMFALLSASCWGSFGIFLKLLSGYGLNQVAILTLAPTSLVIFSLFTLASRGRSVLKITWKSCLWMMFCGMFMLNTVNLSYTRAVSYFPVGIVSVLMYCNIFLVMVMSALFLKNRFTFTKLAASVIAVFGVALVFNVFQQGSVAFAGQGLFWIFLGILCMSVDLVSYKLLMKKGVHYRAVLFYTNLFAVIPLWISNPPWKLAGQIAAAGQAHGGTVWLAVLGFMFIPQIICFSFYFKAIDLLEPTYVSLGYSLDPVSASLLGILVLKERLSLSQVSGIIIIIAVIGWIQIKESRAELPLKSVERGETL